MMHTSLFSLLVLIIFGLSVRCECPENQSSVAPEERILYGKNVTKGEFPHQVLLTNLSKDGKTTPTNHPRISTYICGGSIISSQHILTTADCAARKDFAIYVGVFDRERLEDDGVQKVSSSDVFIHPCYDPENNDSISFSFNDLAIIKLSKPLTLGGLVEKITIDEDNRATKEKLTTALGWGVVSFQTTHYSRILQKTPSMKVVEREDCRSRGIKLNKTFNSESQICAYSDLDEFLCAGDFGGPLLCDKVLCGVTASVYSKCRLSRCNGPGIFTRVYHYRKWIKEIVLETNLDSEEGCIGKRIAPHRAKTPRAKCSSLRPPLAIYGICLPLPLLFFSIWTSISF